MTPWVGRVNYNAQKIGHVIYMTGGTIPMPGKVLFVFDPTRRHFL